MRADISTNRQRTMPLPHLHENIWMSHRSRNILCRTPFSVNQSFQSFYTSAISMSRQSAIERLESRLLLLPPSGMTPLSQNSTPTPRHSGPQSSPSSLTYGNRPSHKSSYSHKQPGHYRTSAILILDLSLEQSALSQPHILKSHDHQQNSVQAHRN